ncbi:serine hydrolase domain-containing protein [uncultured Croceitalea sp.]|uniref:serine hydrolase domain-containing protein n=1 Tax=uncultured Croceitalea sp. TaxID=1798908 RepID=UPI003305899C
MQKGLITLFLIVFGLTISIGQNTTKTLDSEIKNLYKSLEIPGFSVAIVNSDSVVFQKSYGYENLDQHLRFSAKKRFNIASISKTFIGIGIMSLIEQGKFTLDTPINDLLPFKVYNPNNSTKITIRHLATHTSSILDNDIGQKSWYLDGALKLSKKEVDRDTYKTFCSWADNTRTSLGDFLKSSLTKEGNHYSKKRFAKTAPGDTYVYSNIGAALAAYIIELKTGMSYDVFIEKLVAKEFGFPPNVWKHTSEQLPTSYFQNKIEIPTYRPILYPTGGMMLSCEELSRYLSSMIKGFKGESKILKPESFQKMMNLSEGNGVFWELKGNKVGHNGGNYGVICLMSFDKETGIGKILMTNISSYASDNILKQVVKIWGAI